MIKKRKKFNTGFSLAEMMVVLLIMSIVAAALLPLIVQKTHETNDSPVENPLWSASTQDTTDIYPTSTLFSNAQVLLNSATGNDDAKLVTSDIAFNNSGTNYGIFSADNSIRVGSTQSASSGGIAIGSGSQLSAVGTGSVALGNSSAGHADGSVAIGDSIANDTSSPSVAIGNASASDESVALGKSTASSYSFAASLNATASNGSQAYGTNATASNNAIAIGAGSSSSVSAKATGVGAIAIGANTNANGSNAIAIGYGANAAAGHTEIGSDSISNCYFDGTVLQSGHSFSPSDRRLKNVNSIFNSGLDSIDKFKLYNYTFKKDKRKTPQVGVMAQDLQRIFPNAVIKDKKGYLSIRQDDMFYMLINSIKQLHKVELNVLSRINAAKLKLNKFANLERVNTSKVDNLVKRNEKLQEENSDIERRIAKLEKKVR